MHSVSLLGQPPPVDFFHACYAARMRIALIEVAVFGAAALVASLGALAACSDGSGKTEVGSVSVLSDGSASGSSTGGGTMIAVDADVFAACTEAGGHCLDDGMGCRKGGPQYCGDNPGGPLCCFDPL